MLPLSLLILGCYTYSIYRLSIDIAGTSIAYMSRDNRCNICNIECSSWTAHDDKNGAIRVMVSSYYMISNAIEVNNILSDHNVISINYIIIQAPFLDLYSHQYGLETIKTISNTGYITKNIIIPLINGTGTVFPVMIIFCIRDSLREYKSNYVILSSMKLSLYN
jgi:hypothetical protein